MQENFRFREDILEFACPRSRLLRDTTMTTRTPTLNFEGVAVRYSYEYVNAVSA